MFSWSNFKTGTETARIADSWDFLRQRLGSSGLEKASRTRKLRQRAKTCDGRVQSVRASRAEMIRCSGGVFFYVFIPLLLSASLVLSTKGFQMESCLAVAPTPVASALSTTSRPRCVLLAGSARGGTSWALKVLDSHPRIHGCHEPFYQLSNNLELQGVFNRIKSGEGTAADTDVLTRQLMKACLETQKPPFFPKAFLKTPALLRTAAWSLAKVIQPMNPVFSYLSSGELNEQHRIVMKNRPFPGLERILEAMQASVLILLRHPCGVVSSWLRGVRMGVMKADSVVPEKVWAQYEDYLRPIGFAPEDLASMSSAGLLAINWLVDKLLFEQYQANSLMKAHVLVYCNAVRNPEQEWSKVFEWLHLPFDPAVRSFLIQSTQPGFDIRSLLGKKYSYFSVQRGQTSPMDAWRKAMTAEEIREVMRIVTPHFPVERYWPESLC